jgi:hypothetical protein
MPTSPTGFDVYYQSAMNAYQPTIDAETRQAKAGLADQGLYSSTAGQSALAGIRQKYVSQAQKDAMSAAQTQQQNAITNALNAWEMQASSGLKAKELMGSDYALQLPNNYDLFKDLYGVRYSMPTSSATGDPKASFYGAAGMGDARMNEDLYYNVDGKTVREKELAQTAADNASARALQQAQIDLGKQEFEWQKQQDEQKNDVWSNIGALVDGNYTYDSAKGLVGKYEPKQLMGLIKGTYGIDIEQLAKQGDERAIGLYKTMYPNTWQARLSMTDPVTSTTNLLSKPFAKLGKQPTSPVSTSSTLAASPDSPQTYGWLTGHVGQGSDTGAQTDSDKAINAIRAWFSRIYGGNHQPLFGQAMANDEETKRLAAQAYNNLY